MTRRNIRPPQLVVAALFGLLCVFFNECTAFSTTRSGLVHTNRQSSRLLLKNYLPDSASSSSSSSSSSTSNCLFRHPSSLLPDQRTISSRSGDNNSITRLQAIPLPEVWVTSIVPPFLGLIKSEWGVSYGYGFAVAFSAMNVLSAAATTTTAAQLPPIVSCQAAALIFFGVRLNLFLFIRTRVSQRMKEFEKKIEERAIARGSRLTRLPFILSCGLLYYGLVCPLILTSQLSKAKDVPALAFNVMKVLLTGQWLGYLLAAIGDLTKSYAKLKNKDEDYLVTTGIFSKLRHPNYSGEILAWTCNALCGSLAGAYILRTVRPVPLSVIATMTTATVGWMGIVFVLLRATTSLEKRQKENYGDSSKYQEWVSKTWRGWTLPDAKSETPPPAVEEHHEISMDSETEEDLGSGI
eukprot:CAMPEP_0113483568 /NCGR_PEP_ID=MMETSP0014_2-20120614/23501_1 /TAXON_ID=2857 /ORGANISM="Nitzschia sp." /LENGTH=408 /DNA_ID=CAMNT_0000377119 /DNA_START=29 /DNA_END=1255 /DNA_ORIENTATION=+ /assembly_acc=CAM_ASM_000159